MEVVDKGKEWMEWLESPEMKRKKRNRVILALVLFILFWAGSLLVRRSGVITGQVHAVTLENAVVEPGNTTVAYLVEAGYGFSDLEHVKVTMDGLIYDDVFDVSMKTESKSDYFLILVRDGKQYARVEVLNDGYWSKPFSECVIRSITVEADYEGAGQAALENIPLEELTVDKLTQIAGMEPDAEDRAYTWKKTVYSMKLELESDGAVKSFTSSCRK